MGLAGRVRGPSWKRNEAGDPDGENDLGQRPGVRKELVLFLWLGSNGGREVGRRARSRLSEAEELTLGSLGVALVQARVQRLLKSL